MSEDQRLALFQKKEIRKQLHGGEWWFVITDVIRALTDSSNPAQYLQNVRRRDEELAELFEPVDKGGVQIEPPLFLPFTTPGGKQTLRCWNTEGIFRLVQSIPSKKAEPFKRWLARVGYERVQEIENPELAQKRMKMLYKLKGYPDDWIERRVQGMEVRHELTEEWEKRGVTEAQDYAILTAEISKATFGVTPSEYKKLKGIKRENLRDHMSKLELLFTQLGEASTTEIARTDDVYGMAGNKDAAKRGGAVAGAAREQLEKETGRRVIRSTKNVLDE
ncbi:MAG TPA: Bro-N domain-containing protein [Candidatus Saccharibacteria bacterium]|nr:Bro-N domain-containing protein [Candidatus Saccharibacteria bacterium]HMR38142.1 Bro-N domain-containing protein [Candidatus Saccharibacteria bacterium]